MNNVIDEVNYQNLFKIFDAIYIQLNEFVSQCFCKKNKTVVV